MIEDPNRHAATILQTAGSSYNRQRGAPVAPIRPVLQRTSGGPSGKQPVTEPLHYISLRDVARRIQSREISPVELTTRMLDRIAAVDGKLKSYATVMREQALEAAKRAEEEIQRGSYRGPLHGVPYRSEGSVLHERRSHHGGNQHSRRLPPGS